MWTEHLRKSGVGWIDGMRGMGLGWGCRRTHSTAVVGGSAVSIAGAACACLRPVAASRRQTDPLPRQAPL